MINKIKSLFKKEEVKPEEKPSEEPKVVSTEIDIDFSVSPTDDEVDGFYNSRPTFEKHEEKITNADKEEIKMHFILAAVKESISSSEIEKDRAKEKNTPLTKPMDYAEQSRLIVMENGRRTLTEKDDKAKNKAHAVYYKAFQEEIKYVAEKIYNQIYWSQTLKINNEYVEKLAKHNKKPDMELQLNNAWLRVKLDQKASGKDKLKLEFMSLHKELNLQKTRFDELRTHIFDLTIEELNEFSLRKFNETMDKEEKERRERMNEPAKLPKKDGK